MRNDYENMRRDGIDAARERCLHTVELISRSWEQEFKRL